MEKSTKAAFLTVERLDQEIARLAFSDIRKFYDDAGNLRPITELDDDAAAALSGVEVMEEYSGTGENRTLDGYVKKLKLWDKGSALTLAARRLGLLKDKVEHSGSVSLESLVAGSMAKDDDAKG